MFERREVGEDAWTPEKEDVVHFLMCGYFRDAEAVMEEMKANPMLAFRLTPFAFYRWNPNL